MRIALLASRRLRNGPLSPLLSFARDFEHFLSQHDLITTDGCYRAIKRAGLFRHNRRLQASGPGLRGALVHIAAGVLQSDRAEHEIDVVIYLVDPRDPSSNYPETNALKRECVVHRRPFLATSRSAKVWAAFQWRDLGASSFLTYTLDAFSLSNDHAKNLPLGRQTVALVAHDKKKGEMLRFAREHIDFLLAFASRVATGTTGALLNGSQPARLPAEEWQELRQPFEELADAMRGRSLPNGRFVETLRSGPDGGDVEIADRVLRGDCQVIFFFEDPHVARQHEMDIQLLERTGRAKAKVICIHDYKTAGDLAQRWKPDPHAPDAEPLLVATALRQQFDVKAILVDGDHAAGKRTPWERILEAGAWVLLSQISMLAADRKRQGEIVRVTISWGKGLTELVLEMAKLQDKLADRHDDDLPPNTTLGRERRLQIFDNRFLRPGNVCVGPMQGIMGAADDDVEANAIARELARLLDGRALELSLAALTARKSARSPSPIRHVQRPMHDHWEETDLLITTCAPPERSYPGLVPAPDFTEHYAQVKNTWGDFGGIYVDRPNGKVFKPQDYERVGMSYENVCSIRERGGETVLVVGQQEQRLDIARAILQMGVMSVLITDIDFAKRLLGAPLTNHHSA